MIVISSGRGAHVVVTIIILIIIINNNNTTVTVTTLHWWQRQQRRRWRWPLHRRKHYLQSPSVTFRKLTSRSCRLNSSFSFSYSFQRHEFAYLPGGTSVSNHRPCPARGAGSRLIRGSSAIIGQQHEAAHHVRMMTLMANRSL